MADSTPIARAFCFSATSRDLIPSYSIRATAIAAMPAGAVWGLAVSAETNTDISAVKYDNVLLEPLAGQAAPGNAWTGADIGSPGVAGSNSLSGSIYTVDRKSVV